MTGELRPTYHEMRVTSEGVKKRDLNGRPRTKRGGSGADVRTRSAGKTRLFGSCASGKNSIYPGRNNAERRSRD